MDLTNKNYNAFFSLATVAAVNRFDVLVVAGDLTSENIHYVESIHVYWDD